MKYDSWKTIKSIENDYVNSLSSIVKSLNEIAKKSKGNESEYIKNMNEFQESDVFEKFVNKSVFRMVSHVSKFNYSTWRKAAFKNQKSRLIYRSLMREVNEQLNLDIKTQIIENANLIKTLPNDVAQKVVNDIKDYTFEGLRSSTIASIIKDKTSQHAKASARLIARTEVSKTTTALCKARSENLGIKWYIWRTALDGNRVRKSHQIMEGVLVNWNNPPSPEELAGEKNVGRYHAGSIWNCRCYPEPLVEIDDIKWPHKIYKDGSIQTITKKEFELNYE